MYLKALELQGFKSFPDKVKLTFDKGLTAVVGPNGSGKSNIGDAVRWVLGEQSTKTLRGNKMEDVIFSGTKKRKQMGFAAVTLLIDNQSGALGDTYGQEVSITRKLYRSGESEYRINGKAVRLKDVNELFMDTGLGKDGYSMIGQGKIAEIVSAKSTDRRDIFEEAAGVSKFRYRKQEAQRKLEGAQENLVRLQDIVAELESRLEPLRMQAEKAKKFLQLSAQQRELEIALWVQKTDTMRTSLQALSEELLQAKAQYHNLELDLEEADEKMQDGYRSMQESTLKVTALREQIRATEVEIGSLQAALAVAENELQHIRQTLENLEQQKKALVQQTEAAAQQDTQLLQRKAALEAQRNLLQEHTGQLELQWVQLEQQMQELGKGSDAVGAALQQFYQKQSADQVALDTVQQQLLDLQARCVAQDAKLAAMQQTLVQHERAEQAAAEAEAAAKQAVTEAKNQLQGYDQLQTQAEQQLQEHRTAFEQVSFSIRENRQRQRLLMDMEQNMEGVTGSVKAILRADGGHPHGVCGTVAQCLETDAQYGVAIETALGGAMQNVIVEQESVAKQWIRYLAQRKAGRATFLPLTSVKGKILYEPGLSEEFGFVDLACNLVRYQEKYEPVVRFLLGRIAVAEDLDAGAAIAKKYGYRFRIVTLDGQVIHAGGSFTGGSAQRSGGMLTRKSEIAALGETITQLSSQQQTLQQRLQQAEAKQQKLLAAMGDLRESCNTAQQEAIRAHGTWETSHYQLEQTKLRCQEQQQERATLEQMRQQGTEKQQQLQESLRQTEQNIAQTRADLDMQQGQRAAFQQQQAELAEQRAALRIQAAELEKDVQSAQQALDFHHQTQQTLTQQFQQLQQDHQLQQEQIAQKQTELQEGTKRLEQLRVSCQENRQEITHWQTVHDQQDQSIRQIQSGLKALNDAKEKFAGNMTRLDERKASVQQEYDTLISRMLEQYELTRSEAVQQAKPLEDPVQAQRDLTIIKNQVRSLGSVNLESVEEYQAVSDRYRFLSEQMQDAATSKQELEQLIADLTQEMCRLFTESFAKINRNFRQIFRELFDGGDANLLLTDPEHVLESGIEIQVAPPGKVIKNLISLSGGEQTFVAIAIYFAILKLRPAPFCILDEIDAALDEGNVRKYAQYLSHFVDTTQFILVTHRRSAMEEANVLYGVTMQEDGISKLLRMEQDTFESLTEPGLVPHAERQE